MVQNILSMFAAASPEQLENGLHWYATAAEICRQMCPMAPGKAAGIIAALSPSQPWGRNILYAKQVIDGQRAGIAAYGANVAKAARIAAGDQPLNVLSGPKVRAFYACILSGGNTSEVCVDGHAYAIAKGERIPIKQAKFGPAVYRKIADAYREAAAEIGLPAAIVQAVTWVVYRDLHKLSYAG